MFKTNHALGGPTFLLNKWYQSQVYDRVKSPDYCLRESEVGEARSSQVTQVTSSLGSHSAPRGWFKLKLRFYE